MSHKTTENKIMTVHTVLWIIASVAFAIIGTAIIIFGIKTYVDDAELKGSTPEATATITRIDTYRDNDSSEEPTEHHNVYVTFAVNGKEYEGKLTNYTYTANMREGETVKIHYNPDNPSDFRGANLSTGLFLMIGMGLVFLFAGIGLLVSRLKAK